MAQFRVWCQREGERVSGDDILCVKEAGGEIVGARHREAVRQLAVQCMVGQVTVPQVAGIVEHVIRDHIGNLALPQMFNQPLCHGLDLRFVLAVIGQLVQPLILSKVCWVERMANELWQGHDSERGAPHRHGEQQCKDPETKLWYFEMLDTLCQTRRTAEKQNDIGGHVQQHLMGAGILHSGK